MTLQTTIPLADYIENGVTLAHPIPFQFQLASDIVCSRIVAAVETPLTLGTDYSVSGGGGTTGTVTKISAGVDGTIFRIKRATPRAQTMDYTAGDAFPAESHEAALDRLAAVDQEQDVAIRDLSSRAVHVPVGETAPELPAKALRAGKYLAGDALGNLVPATGTGSDPALRSDLAASGGYALVSGMPLNAWGNGLANDRAALVAEDLLRPLDLPAGNYLIGSSVTFTKRVKFRPGAKLLIGSGVTVTFAGGVSAEVAQIFACTGTGAVVIDPTSTPSGWADWWGTDEIAIMAAHKALTFLLLGPHDYHVNSTVIFDQSYKHVIGSGGSSEGFGGMRFVYDGADKATATIVQVGNLQTANVLLATRRLKVRGINTVRSSAIAPPSSGRREDGAKGWLIAGLYEGEVADCFDNGSAVPFRVYATCATQIRRCNSVNATPAIVNGQPDLFSGMVIGGNSPCFGFIGANASLQVIDCGCAGAVGASRLGLYLFGYIADTWIIQFEQSQMETGIWIDGAKSDGSGIPAELSAHVDVRVGGTVLDANGASCITIKNINAGGSVELVADNGTLIGNSAAVLIDTCVGAIHLNGGKFVSDGAHDDQGIVITNSKRVYVNATQLVQFKRGVKGVNSSALRLLPIVNRQSASGENGVDLQGVTRSYVAPIVDGAAGALNYGVAADAATQNCEVNLTAINPATLLGGAVNRKVWYNGAAVAADPFGTGNLRSGVLT